MTPSETVPRRPGRALPLAALALLVGSLTAQLPDDFRTASVVPAAQDGEFRAHGDLDQDGDVDLLHFYGGAFGWSGVRIFTNLGGGRFAPGPDLPFSFPAAYPSGDLQPYVADFDGDSNLDFAIARDGAGTAPGEGVEFFLGDGLGGFPRRALAPVANPRWLAVGNIDADAASELALASTNANLQPELSWIDFQGGAPLQLPGLAVATGGAPMPFVFAAIDVDGDGLDDIAATARTATPIDQVRFFPTLAGRPALGAAFPLPLSMQDQNHRILAGDLDGDGDRDLLVVKMATTDLGPTVLPLERTSQGWSLHPAQTVPTPTTGWFQPHSAQLADWNGDGWLDLLSGSPRFDALQSTRDWRFAEGFDAPTTGQGMGGGAADCDGDGRLDFIAGWSIHKGDGSFDLQVAQPLPFLPSQAVDLDGDGDVDLLQDFPLLGHFNTSFLAANDGSGAFMSSARSLPAPLLAPFFDAPIARADFDGDGRQELVALSFAAQFPFPTFPRTPVAMERLIDRGAGGLVVAGTATAPGDFVTPPASAADRLWAAGDLDGDGDLDLLMDGGYRPNQSAQFGAFVPAWNGRGRAAADADGDGFVDVLTTAYNGGGTAVALQRGGSGGFAAIALGAVAGEASAQFRDLDGDGDLDVMAAAPAQPGLTLFENRNGQFFAAGTALPEALVRDLAAVVADDIDGDGAVDLLVCQRRTGHLGAVFETAARFRLTGPNLTFTLAAEHLLPLGASPLGFADVDADGDPDLVGATVLFSQWLPQTAGSSRQYGEGRAPQGGAAPLLGALGPVRSASVADELRIVWGSPGAIPLLAFSLFPTDQPDQPFAGLSLYVSGPEVLVLPPLQGVPGIADSGRLSLPLPNLPFLSGWTIAHQVFTVDPLHGYAFAASNGLLVTYGQ